MKTFDQLEAVTSLENNALLVANNASNTATNKISFANMKNQILSDVPDHYESSTVVAATNSGQSNAEATNGNVHLNHIENNSVKSSHTITGSGATTVTSDSSGDITISSTNTWTAFVGATSENDGTAGYVPAPTASDVNKFFKADGSWADPTSVLGTAAAKNYTDLYDSNGNDVTTGKAVAAALATLPEPMVFKGSLGTGGTITTLPAASSSGSSKNTGFTYKVIENGTYDSQNAIVGDTFISTGSAWIRIPSGDEPSGTVLSVGITQGDGISVSGGPITTSGNITVSHADTSTQSSVTNDGRTYIQSITLDDMGHVTAISSATETVVDTDTHYASSTVVGASASATTNAAASTNGDVYLNHVENDAVTSSHNITGTGATTVTSDANGAITINSTDTDTHYASSTVVAATSAGTSDAAATNGNVFLNHVENNALVSSHKIVGSGATTVTSDANGDIMINSAEFPSEIECGFES